MSLEDTKIMTKKASFLPTPTFGEFLSKEYMKPLHLSAYRLAKDIYVPVSRIQDLLHNRRSVTADTSLRLGLYFGVSPDFFLKIQNDLDLRKARIQAKDELASIKPYKKA
jgi:addiction module HigA family antidote